MFSTITSAAAKTARAACTNKYTAPIVKPVAVAGMIVAFPVVAAVQMHQAGYNDK